MKTLEAVCETPVRQLFPELPSFLDYNIAWRAGEISLAEVLAVPRSPLIIGTIPDLYAFRREPIDESGMHGEQSQAALDAIDAFAQAHSIPTTSYSDIWAERTKERISYPHVDGLVPEDILLEANVTDKDPTIFYAMELNGFTKTISSNDIVRRINKLLQDEPEKLFAEGSPQPGEIVAFDGTVPHRGPNTRDERILLRKTFCAHN